jgi:hypothetical protein
MTLHSWYAKLSGFNSCAHLLYSQNQIECNVVLQLAQQLQDQGKQYQIITPYEGQRSTIEEGMKASGLNWENKCFNVDAFQGWSLSLP